MILHHSNSRRNRRLSNTIKVINICLEPKGDDGYLVLFCNTLINNGHAPIAKRTTQNKAAGPEPVNY